jgi:hypothetical protein
MPKYDCCADGAKHQRAEGLFRSYNACPYTCPWPMYDRPVGRQASLPVARGLVDWVARTAPSGRSIMSQLSHVVLTGIVS